MVVSASAVEKAVISPSSQEMVGAWVEAGVEAEAWVIAAAWAGAWVVEEVWALLVTLWRLGLLPGPWRQSRRAQRLEAVPWRQSRRAQRLGVARTTMQPARVLLRELLALL